jgi:acyl carrier protein
MESDSVEATETPNTTYLTQLWSEQLNVPNLGIQDDFFDAGGSSMQVIEMLMTVSGKFGKEIDFAEFFRDPCIRNLGELLEH